MEYKPPVSSSACKRACCWTPTGPCARQHKCYCHVRTAAEVRAETRAAQQRAFDYALALTADKNDD